jgi:SAM-dependent methyltransferase
MNLIDMINRVPIPDPWTEGDNIPWNEPSFSERMLSEHLSQEHHAASRKFDKIDQHVEWIHSYLLSGKLSRILDLGCGPGLYVNRLAKLGHHCVGIDFSPASIVYAKHTARSESLDCQFVEADMREAAYGRDFDMVMLINGEFNVFSPADARLILSKAYQALKPGGILVLEPHTFEAIWQWGERTPSWYSSKKGVFSSTPHIVMEEFFWNQDLHTTTNRYFILDANSNEVILYSQSLMAYKNREYGSLLQDNGFTAVDFYPSLTGSTDPEQTHFLVLTAVKPFR